MKNFVQISEIVTRTAPSGGINAGEGRLLGGEFHIAQTSADEGEAYSALTVGIVTLPVADGQIFAGVGAPVYWDDGECYASSGGTRPQIGTADAIDLGDVDVRLAGTVIPPTQGDGGGPVDVDVDADDVSFDPGDTGMDSTNAGAAIREVVHFVMGNAGTDGKVFPVVFKTTGATEVEFEFPDFNCEVLKIEQYIKTPKDTDGVVEIHTGAGKTGDKIGEMAADAAGNDMIVPLDDGDLLQITAGAKWYITKSDAVIGGVLLVTVRKVD
jgi:predicted RecA/RadA family phage recombinase